MTSKKQVTGGSSSKKSPTKKLNIPPPDTKRDPLLAELFCHFIPFESAIIANHGVNKIVARSYGKFYSRELDSKVYAHSAERVINFIEQTVHLQSAPIDLGESEQNSFHDWEKSEEPVFFVSYTL